MASLNLTVEDGSPLIFYDPAGAWTDSPNDDSLLFNYSGMSLHTTSTEGATATISFHGTGLTIYGGHRPTYGTYTVSLDGQGLSKGNASDIQASSTQLLATISGLPDGNHTAVITNIGPAIDIDYAIIECQIGSGSELITTVYDDSDSHISYLPSDSDWIVNNKPTFMNGTLHFTNVTDASASIYFAGDAVALYGTVSPDHANIRVSLDGRETTFSGGSNGVVSSLHSQVLLYSFNGLGPENHTLTVSADQEPNTGPFIDIDAIIVYSSNGTNSDGEAVNGARQPVASSLSSGASLPDRKSVGTRAIVGAVLGGVCGMALLAALFFLLYRRKHLARPRDDTVSPSTPDLPMQRPEMFETARDDDNTPLRLEPLRAPRYQSRLSIAPSYYSGGTGGWDHMSAGHTRAPSMASVTSTTPIIRTVPTLKTPQPPNRFGAGLQAIPKTLKNAVWSAFFGLFFRKFFWDFVGGIIRDPGGVQPAPGAAVFISLIVKAPVIQIFTMIIGAFLIVVEFPLPQFKALAIYRSFVFRIVLLLFQSFLTVLFYQGTNASLWSLIAVFCYTRAQMLGEQMEEAKQNRGKGGVA
ncbi:uncharacterized protein EV420DRAFT_1762598 [Desarmillaria tabescens]|uniref:DUF7727 domain-containing protein n=1 Tax=Armillaria tabescens TaxID=1929756 RepID=A0AA39N957_ARMTA|nr:uncharacterized protein EV420DRAFT_1762598 [Desarmillaria tabescens]KAK0461313.1 hypothetical protein EV420DRAFT_1762598 [Desarmillaria tabescens]